MGTTWAMQWFWGLNCKFQCWSYGLLIHSRHATTVLLLLSNEPESSINCNKPKEALPYHLILYRPCNKMTCDYPIYGTDRLLNNRNGVRGIHVHAINISCKECIGGSWNARDITVNAKTNPTKYTKLSGLYHSTKDMGYSRSSVGIALDCRPAGWAIDPAYGVWFIQKFASLTQVAPQPSIGLSVSVQNCGLKHLSFIQKDIRAFRVYSVSSFKFFLIDWWSVVIGILEVLFP